MTTIKLENGTIAEVAEYKVETDLIEFQNNPLIEALPKIQSYQEVIDRLSFYPPFNKQERFLEDYKRVHCIQRLFQYFQPFPLHLEMYSSIDRALRTGYLTRNPLSKEYIDSFYGDHAVKPRPSFGNVANQTGQTISIIGTSGVGKTRTLQRILEMYPIVISHTEYEKNPLNMYQITYLFIQTPFDGSVKTIIFDFFYQFDQIMGTSYFERYANSRLSTSQLMPVIASLSKNIGLLIIDEIQHLKSMKRKNSTEVLNFMTTLINLVNIPIVMVGTPKAMEVLQSQFRQARRSLNPGNIIWDRLKKDEVWDLFFRGLFKYQWTKNETDFTEELSALFYELTQGICDICIKLFMMVQLRAISSGEERISPNLVKKVANEELKIVQPMINALKNGNVQKLIEYDDLLMPNIETFMQREQIKLDQQQIMKSLKQNVEDKMKVSEMIEQAVFQLKILGIEEIKAKELISQILNKEMISDVTILVKKVYSTIANVQQEEYQNHSLDMREIIEEGKSFEMSAYQSLLEAGLIKNEYRMSDVL
ncbi:ATP-binding protein [Ureibacillus chungkukjangi]|uniref:ATP-binding protein n=1 Tax=Ureibacillus chungkukjangi TaxID=1202712 RepID=UPI00203BF059|nr:ATP-binding protein [Ureibacillus chungkukjangi]MCM3390602.1 ATP-binding protein [Ureibacillus chungkukjangi]